MYLIVFVGISRGLYNDKVFLCGCVHPLKKANERDLEETSVHIFVTVHVRIAGTNREKRSPQHGMVPPSDINNFHSHVKISGTKSHERFHREGL